MLMIKRIAVAMALSLAVLMGSAVMSSPAQADNWQEMAEDCDYNTPPFGSAAYSVNGYPVWLSTNWQYVGDWTSFCEDINIAPPAGYLWNSGVVKARTYMCNSAGSCWYNAWRNCQGGCMPATDMADGTRYQVHMYSNANLGSYMQIWD